MKRTITVCDNCKKELSLNSETYHIDFASSKFCDAAGDIDYDSLRVELCGGCAKNAVESLKQIEKKELISITREEFEELCEVAYDAWRDVNKQHDIFDWPPYIPYRILDDCTKSYYQAMIIKILGALRNKM